MNERLGNSSFQNATAFRLWYGGLRQKLILILIGFFLLTTAIVIFIIIKKTYQPPLSLIKAVPPETIFYAEIKNEELGNRKIKEWFETNFKKYFYPYFYQVGFFPKRLERLKEEGLLKISFLVFPSLEEAEKETGVLFLFPSKKHLEPLIAQVFYDLPYAATHKEIVILASSENALNQITRLLRRPEYEDRAKGFHQELTRHLYGNYFFSSFWKGEFLQSEIKKGNITRDTGLNLAQFLLDEKAPFYLNLQNRKEGIVFNLVTSSIKNFRSGSSGYYGGYISERALGFIPPEESFLVLSNINLSQSLYSVENFLKKKEPNLLSLLKLRKEQLFEDYLLDWKFLEDLFNRPTLLVIEMKSTHDMKELELSKINFLFPTSYKYAVLLSFDKPKEIDSQVGEIEKTVSGLLAHLLPLEVIKILPDGTKVTELKADPSLFHFKTIEKDPLIHFLEEQKVNFEFAYTKIGNFLILSNSKEFLKKMIDFNPQKEKWKNEVLRCLKSRKGEVIILNNIKFLEPLKMMILESREINQELGILGCIY